MMEEVSVVVVEEVAVIMTVVRRDPGTWMNPHVIALMMIMTRMITANIMMSISRKRNGKSTGMIARIMMKSFDQLYLRQLSQNFPKLVSTSSLPQFEQYLI